MTDCPPERHDQIAATHSRDALIAITARALKTGIRKRDYRGGPAGLLSDLLFSCGYTMTPKRIRSITSQYFLEFDQAPIHLGEKSLSRKPAR